VNPQQGLIYLREELSVSSPLLPIQESNPGPRLPLNSELRHTPQGFSSHHSIVQINHLASPPKEVEGERPAKLKLEHLQDPELHL